MKCVICKKKARIRFSPDMDIKGIGACKKHHSDGIIAYFMLLRGDEDMFWSFIEDHTDYKKEN